MLILLGIFAPADLEGDGQTDGARHLRGQGPEVEGLNHDA